jgi:hypothetical protein
MYNYQPKENKMSELYKEKILKDINDIPIDMLPKFYKIVHILKTELINTKRKSNHRNSLKGIWKGSEIDDQLFEEAKKSVFKYE